MPALRSRLALLISAAALAGALPACSTDDAIERDAKDAQQTLDKSAGSADEKVKDAAQDAGDDVEKGINDVDGK